MNSKPIVAVAMSGGVDSSVAAALLVEQGYSVIGLMLRLWSERSEQSNLSEQSKLSEQGESEADPSNRCCTPDSIALARRVAEVLSIPFYMIDAKQLFYNAVVNPFIFGYTHNLTPNPCVACNRLVRWGFLLDYALAAGADYLATGHYARLALVDAHPIQLRRGHDQRKDQSYVLHVLTQEQLSHAMFPLGDYEKPYVRELARRYNLPVAERPESQDLCFVGGDGDYRQFLVHHEPQAAQPGDIIDQQGKIMGKHQGIAFYTIGQRKGLAINARGPWYVLNKDAARNTLIVGPHAQSGRDSLYAGPMNWISGDVPAFPLAAQVKIRYKSRDLPAMVDALEGDQVLVKFENLVYDITPGQAAVLYNGEECLGGGIIMHPPE